MTVDILANLKRATAEIELKDLERAVLFMISKVVGKPIASIRGDQRLVEDLGIDSMDIVGLGLEIEDYIYDITGHTPIFKGSNPLREQGTVQKVIDYVLNYAREHRLYVI